MNSEKIIFASQNIHKLQEATDILRSLQEPLDITPLPASFNSQTLPETGKSLEENSLQKATYVHHALQCPCIADDSGLFVDALGGEPGIYSARYAGPHATDAQNLHKLLGKMENIPNRSCEFRCVVTYIDTHSHSFQFVGKVAGRLTTASSGIHGFGYDPIFVPEGFSETLAQLPSEIKNKLSHRYRALHAWAQFLIQHSR